MLNLSLQPVTAKLLEQVVQLDRCCFGQLWSAAQYQREFDSPNSEILVLVTQSTETQATEQVLAYGCVWAIVDEAHVTIVAVHPELRRKGFGQLMLWGLLQVAVDRQLSHATLEVRISNTEAIRLYEQFGFQTAGRRKKYYADTGEDALILWKNHLSSQTSREQLIQHKQNLDQKFQRQQLNLKVVFDTAAHSSIDITD